MLVIMTTLLASGSIVMDALQAFLEDVKKHKLAEGHFLGFLHIMIGRRISREDGTPVSGGMTWRELAGWLKKVRWKKDAVHELGLDAEDLPPRDREKFWYVAVNRAGVDSEEAVKDGDELAGIFAEHGYEVGPAPGASS